MTSFVLKIIGILTMICDHLSYAIFGKFTILNVIGRIAFPIFAYQLVVGYTNTKNKEKHILKLLIFSIISQIPFMMFLSTFTNQIIINVFFTFFIALVALYIYDKCKNKFLAFLIVVGFSIVAQLINTDYGMFGIILVYIFYLFKDKKAIMVTCAFILFLIKYLINIIQYPYMNLEYLLCIIAISISLTIILFHNKKEGPKLKYFFYIFYPLHLLILYCISWLL